MTGSYSVLLRGSVWAFVTNGWEGADYTEPLWLPLTTQSFCQFEPSSLNFPSSSFHSSSPLFWSWESPASFFFIKTPSPLCYKHKRVIHVKSIGGSSGKSIWSQQILCVQGATPEGKQTQLKLSQISQNTDNNISYIQIYVVKMNF